MPPPPGPPPMPPMQITSLPCIVLLVSTNIACASPACVSVVDLPASGSTEVALNLRSHLHEVAGSTLSGRGAGGSVSLPTPAVPLEPLAPTPPPVPAIEELPALLLAPPLPPTLVVPPAAPLLPPLGEPEPPLAVAPVPPEGPGGTGDVPAGLEHAPASSRGRPERQCWRGVRMLI